jgi:hypothetical protein
MNKNLLEDYCNKGLSSYEISRRTNKSKTTVRYWLKKFELRTTPNYFWTENELRESVKKTNSIHDCLLHMNKNTSTGSYNSFRRNIAKYNIDISHFNGKKIGRKKIPNFALFLENSTISRSVIKRRLISDNLIIYECFKCKNTGEWNNNKLTLILDHINGIRNDNRLFNLRFVCPNCNSQLETHCVGNKDT